MTSYINGHVKPYRIVILTLDSHAAGPCARVADRLASDFPGLELSVHAAAEWGESPDTLKAAKDAIATGDIILSNLLFLEEHINAILPDLEARRDHCDAMAGIIADAQVVKLTRMGTLGYVGTAIGHHEAFEKAAWLGQAVDRIRRQEDAHAAPLPRMLKLIPGKAQDLRAWFLVMQYWLGASDDNIEAMVRFLISRYCRHESWRGATAAAPQEYPDTGVYHPDLPERIGTDSDRLPRPAKVHGTVGLLMMRSYVLSSDTAHYDAVIHALEARGLRVHARLCRGSGQPSRN